MRVLPFRKFKPSASAAEDHADSPALEVCPRCGERTIHPDVPATYSIDRRDRGRICAACASVTEVLKIMLPRFETDVGGEGDG